MLQQAKFLIVPRFLFLRLDSIRKQKDDLQNQINKLNQVCGDLEGELATLRYQLEALGKENDMLKQDLMRSKDDNIRVREVCTRVRGEVIDEPNNINKCPTIDGMFPTNTTTRCKEKIAQYYPWSSSLQLTHVICLTYRRESLHAARPK